MLISRLTNNVEQLDTLVTDGVNALVTSAITIAGSFVVLFIIDVELALLSLAAMPLVLAGTWVYGRISGPVYRRSMNTVADVTSYMEESFVGGRVVRSFVQEDRHRRDFDTVNARNRDVDLRTIQLISLYLPFVLLASNLALAAVVVFGGLQVIDGEKQLGVVVSFIGYCGWPWARYRTSGACTRPTRRGWRGSTRSSSCSTSAPRSQTAGRLDLRRCAALSSWRTCASATGPSARTCSTTSR